MSAEITDLISIEDGYFHDGYCDSLAVTPDRLVVRTAMGVDNYGHGLVLDVGRRKRWDIQSRAGYAKFSDGFQVVTGVGVSPDGHRVVCGWKQPDHGTLVLNAYSSSAGRDGRDGQIIGEFAPPRALGGVTVTKAGSRYVAYGLGDVSLAHADVTAAQVGVVRPTLRPVPRGSYGLITLGLSTVAYIEGGLAGNVVIADEQSQQVVFQGAARIAAEGEQLLVGISGGMQRLGGAVQALPVVPQALTLLHGVAYAWCTVGGVQRLYREGTPVLDLPPQTWPVVVSKGFGSQLYVGTTQHLLVVRVA